MLQSCIRRKVPPEDRPRIVTQSASDAVASVDPEKWAHKTSIRERLMLLYQLRTNMKQSMDELSEAIACGRNELLGKDADGSLLYTPNGVKLCSGLAPAYHVTVLIDLYESLDSTGEPLQPVQITTNAEGNYCDIQVLPGTTKEKLVFSNSEYVLRVKGTKPKRTLSPLDKPPGIVATLKGGNTGSAVDVLKAIFLDNKTVVFKGHPLNVHSDAVWQKIYEPLQKAGAISYCHESEGQQLCQNPALSDIYFTGSATVARSILESTKDRSMQVVTECGGVNPVLIVPGIRPWSAEELQNVAAHIVSAAKFFGGAICGRPQLIVTCKQWAQREDFLACVERAIRQGTPPTASFYPGSSDTVDRFHKQYPNQAILIEEHPAKAASFLWVPGVQDTNAYLCKNEAFCQVLGEYRLDTSPEGFLDAAVSFCNQQLFGSLAATILMDEETQQAHPKAVERAVTTLRYGAVCVNGNVAGIFNIPQLTWGGFGEEVLNGKVETGCGNFGDALNYSNVQKSIHYRKFDFAQPTTLFPNPKKWDASLAGGTRLFLDPSWWNLLTYPLAMAWTGLWS